MKTDDLFQIELADCPGGHKAEMWRSFTSWVMVGCKKCGQAAAAHNNPEQAAHDWARMVEISNNEKI